MKTKTQFTNRILSLVLSIMMVVSMLPASALSVFAADGTPVAKVGDTEYTDFATAVANWTDGTTLTLLADVTGLTERIKTYAKGLILDLNGHKIECSDNWTIWIDGDSSSELTIRDSNGGGYIQGVVYAVAGGSKLCLESGTVETVSANGDFTMTGGQIISENGSGLSVNAEVDVVISGGEIYGSNYGVWISTGNVTISGDTKITGADQYAIRSSSFAEIVISGTPTISGGAGEFILDSKITLNTQPADGKVWRVKINTEEITDGIFAVPGEGIALDASKFASAMDGYDVKQNAKGELLLCNHQTAYAAVSNEDGSTHKMLCCCRETTVEASVACSGFGATCQTKAVCAACGQSYGETNPNVHTFNDDGKCVCGAERDTATTVDLSSLTATYVISDSGEYIFTGTGSYGIKVESGNPKIVLNNVNISLTDGDYYENNPINGIHIATTGGTTEILVLGESSITAKAGAGIFVAEGGTVKITGSSREDILSATGASGCSGIGGYVYRTNGSVNCGNIEISNVTVKAFGSDSSMGDRTPAIGGAGNGNCGYITIDNADVYAEGFINPYGYEGSSAIGTGVGWRNREGGTIGEISIINDSKVYVTRGNYCDYIGCCGHENAPAEGVVDATAKSSTIYCYDTTDTTKPIQTLKYGALGGLLKEDGTCEGEHSGGTATCKEQAICGNCGASYGELLDHNWKKGECTYGCNTQHDPHDWESGICNVCGLVCAHTGGTATCTEQAECQHCGASYGELAAHTPDTNGKCTAENCGYQYAAKVGDTFYETIHKALRAAEGINGCTLTLLDDVTLTSMSSYASYVNTGTFTLDLNGKTLSSNKRTLEVMGSADLTIRDGIGGGKIVSTDSSAVYLSGGKLTIESGIFEGSLDGVFLSGSSTLIVKGGTFTGSRAMITGFGSNCVIDLTAIDPSGLTLKNNGSGTFAPKLPEGYGMVGSDGKLLTSLSAEQSATVHKHEYKYTDLGDGNHQQACSCGLTTGEPAAHSTTAEDDKAATCAASAYCSVCESYYGEVDKNNHDETVAYENGFCPYCDAFEPAELVDGVYQISNAGNLYWFAQQVNGGNTAIDGKLTTNIVDNTGDVAGCNGTKAEGWRDWTPIGTSNDRYTGTFDGGSFTVSGLYFNNSGTSDVGLFGYIAGDGAVHDLGVVNSYISGGSDVGGVVGYALATVSVTNCYNSATVIGVNYVGGVVGYSAGPIANCHNSGTVCGTGGIGAAGGVVGRCYRTVTNCHNTGSVTGTGSLGGVVGANSGTVTNCYNTGNVSGSGNGVGGVAGTNTGTVTNCYNTGNVTGSKYTVGGMVGANSGGTVTNCYNTGSVTGSKYYVGGVVGQNGNAGTVTNCYYLTGCAKDGNDAVQFGIGSGTQGNTTADAEGGTTGKSDFSTGEVCYLLNGDQTSVVFKQTCGTGIPVFTGETVYYGYTSCGDTAAKYTNDETISAEKPDHTQKPTYTDNGDGTHSAFYSCCGTTVTEDHTLTYTAKDNVITAVCSANCGYSETATIIARDATYDGLVHNTATVDYSEGWKGGELTVSYENNVNAGTATASITIGEATASYDFSIEKATPTAEDFIFTAPTDLIYDGTAKPATIKVKDGIVGMGEVNVIYFRYASNMWINNDREPIYPATYKVGIWIAEGDNYNAVYSNERIWLGDEFEIKYLTTDAKADISGTMGSNGWYTSDVTLTAPEGYQISKTKYNDGFVSKLTFSAEQNETITYYLKDANGDVAEKTVELKIDKTAPAAQYQIGTDGWKQFINTITFGLFCKDYKTVDIEYTDELSGVAEKQYYISREEITNTSRIAWLDYTDTLSLNATGKYFIYMRVVDNAGNEVILNTEGIVIYGDSIQVTESVSATYNAGTDKAVTVKLNGNTVNAIQNGNAVLTAGTDYTVSADGTITLKASYLDALKAGEYTFTVSYNPQGVETDKVNMTTTFTLIIDKADGKVSNINISNKTYDGTAITVPTFDKLGDGAATIEYKLSDADDNTYTTTAPKNAGNYVVRVTVAEGTNHKKASATTYFAIASAELRDVSVQQNGKLTYNGQAQTPTVSTSVTTVDGSKVTFTYSTESEGPYSSEIPSFTNVGWAHTVYYRATADNHNAYYGSFLVEIEKAAVTEPTIASKPYTGSAQTADISDTDLYTVEKNNGGTEKGSYDVVLKLKDSANYKWSTTDNAEVTLQFVISAAQNAWDTNPSISGWTYGEAAKTPVGTAKYGAVKVVYTGKANDGTDYNSETAPTKAGNYTATFTVTGTEDYSGLSEQVNFTIAKKAVTVTANDASKTYGESDPALTYTHTELVGSDALVITVARTSGENANTYTITASQAEGANPNYEITFKTGTFTIHKATLTVTVEDKTATYGDPVPTYTVKYEGFKNGDDKDDLGGALAFDCGYAQFSDKGEYTIKASGYTSGNYTITYVDGKLTVNAKPITVTIQNATSIYGNALAELKATDNGIVNGETNVYSLAAVATSASNVGKYAITGTALDSNYDVTFVNGEYEITKREITITVDAKNAVVNTTLPTYTYKVEGLVGVDTLVTEPTLTCNANIALIGEYDITASGADAGGNYSIKYVPAKLTVLTDNAVDAAAGYTEELKDYDPATVTSEDKAELDEMLSEINTILADETTTSNGKKALEEVKEQVEKLIKEITDAAEATDTENTEKVENVTQENVTPENKNDLEGAKADLVKALEDNGGNYTEDEKQAIEEEIKRIDDALEVIGNVEAVEEVISKLPAVDTVKPDDEEAIKAITDAQTAYNALSDYEKSLVDEAAKANLDKLVAALVAYDIVEGDGSSWTEDSDHNITFVVNGLFSKFVGIKVDGKDVDKANYEVNAGSTIITLKASYMDTLAVGEHTISVVYTDGSTDGTFKIVAKSNTPATGDDFDIALYGSLMVVSVTALVVLLLASKKRKQAR